jgi:hypothetical protein
VLIFTVSARSSIRRSRRKINQVKVINKKSRRILIMARQAMYIHGNAVVMRYPGGKGDPVGSPHTAGRQMNGVVDPDTRTRIEWSDVVGLHTEAGAIFTGRTNQINRFYASIPTPVWRDDVRAKLARVAVLFSTTSGVNITGIRVFDASVQIPYGFPPMSLGGNHCESWDANVNYFDHPNPPDIRSCVCIEFQVLFANEGDIKFCSVGCDFIVEE